MIVDKGKSKPTIGTSKEGRKEADITNIIKNFYKKIITQN